MGPGGSKRGGEREDQIRNVPWKLQDLQVWRSVFARKIRCFENFCSQPSLPAQRNLLCWPKGQQEGSRGRRPGTGLAPVEDSRGERGWATDFGFLGPLSGSCRGCEGLPYLALEGRAPRRWAVLRGGGWPSVVGWWVPGPWALRTGCPRGAGPAGGGGAPEKGRLLS